LRDLRIYLTKHPREALKVRDTLREDGKGTEGELLGRFIDGSYDGRPQKRVTLVSTWWQLWRMSSLVIVLTVVFSYLLTKYYFDGTKFVDEMKSFFATS
jgi:hypothetical protein